MRGRKLLAPALAVTLLGSMCALAVTDLHGRAQVERTDAEIAVADHQVAALRERLASTRAQADLVGQEIKAVATAVLQTQANDSSTESSITSTEAGIFFAGYDVAELNLCLSGVTQALDQVAVGQSGAAIASLHSVSANCNAARQGG